MFLILKYISTSYFQTGLIKMHDFLSVALDYLVEYHWNALYRGFQASWNWISEK